MNNQSQNYTPLVSTPPSSCQGFVNDSTRIGLTVAHVFVLITAVTGNAFVIHLVRSKNKMKVSFNFLVVNMAVADLVDAVCSVPSNIAFLYVGLQWFSGPFGTFLCKFTYFMILVSILVSTTTLTVITIERYLATTQVLKRPLSICAVKRVMAAIWILACLMSVHELLKMKVMFAHGKYFCYPDLGENWKQRYAIEMIVKFVVTYAFPLWTMVILYSIIVCLLWKKETIGEEISDYNRRFHKQKKGIIKKLVTIVTIFAICWLPVHVNHFLATFNFDVYKCLPPWLVLVFYWLAHANSAINPFLYLMLTKNSRALFKAHLSGMIRLDGSSGRGSNKNKDRPKAESFPLWKRGSRKATKTVDI